MGTIYELTGEYKQLLDMLSDPDYAEFEDAIKETLTLKGEELEAKADNYMMVCKQLEADEKAIKQEEERLAMRRAAVSNNAKRIKNTLTEVMIATNKRKFKTTKFSYRIQSNPPSLKVLDESKIPGEYFVPQPNKLDREQLKKDILNGKIIDGADVTQGESLRVR